eukprot:4840756-Lingulodinium_polyedra.AAC.1
MVGDKLPESAVKVSPKPTALQRSRRSASRDAGRRDSGGFAAASGTPERTSRTYCVMSGWA